MKLIDRYKQQTEIVAREKEILKSINKELIEFRQTCTHSFVKGSCEHCGINEELYKFLKVST